MAMTTDTMVLVGTTKGLFTLRSGDGRGSFALSGPAFAGEEIYSTCLDSRSGSTRVFVGSVSNHWGPVLRRSDDLGATLDRGRTAAPAVPGGIRRRAGPDLAARTRPRRRT